MIRSKYFAAALVLLLTLLLVAGYQWQQPSAVVQPLPDTLAGDFALFALQTPVRSTFPLEIEGDSIAERIVTLRAPVEGVLKSLASTVDGEVLQGHELAVLGSDQLTQKLLENDSKVQELGATVQLYSPTSSPELRKLQTSLDGGKQKYGYAEASFEKVEELFRRGLISGKEHADARVQLQADKLELAVAEREFADAQSLSSATYLKIRNQLDVALLEQEQLRKTQASLRMQAPFAGRVRRYAPPKGHNADGWSVGDTIKAGEPLFYIESSSRMVRIDVSPQLLKYFDVGDTVSVLSKGQQARAYPGRVQEIIRTPYEEGGSGLEESVAQIRIAIPDEAFARVENSKVTVSKDVPQQGISVPVEWLLSEGGERFVYVKNCSDESARFVRRRISLSAEQHGTALISAGLSQGECIAQVSQGTPWGR